MSQFSIEPYRLSVALLLSLTVGCGSEEQSGGIPALSSTGTQTAPTTAMTQGAVPGLTTAGSGNGLNDMSAGGTSSDRTMPTTSASATPGTAGVATVVGQGGATGSGGSSPENTNGGAMVTVDAGVVVMGESDGGMNEAANGDEGGAGMGGAGGAPVLDGEPADPVFTSNVRLNDDRGQGRQAEVSLATGPNGLAIAGWMDERSERVCAFTVSSDGGQTWSENYTISKTSGTFVGDPAVAIDGGGTLYAVCQEYGLDQIRMMTSSDAGVTWSETRPIQSAPDKPWATGGQTQGELFVSWLGEQAGIKRSRDGGDTWGPIQPLGNIIHGTAIVTSTTGLVHVPFNLDSDHNQLRYLRSTDGGDTWDDFRDLLPDMGSFCFECSPRQHPIVGAAADPTGEIVAMTWSSRMNGPQENVWMLYSTDGGDTWTDPIGVHADETDARQFQPWVAVDAHGRVHVAWTDLRDDGLNKTFYARSADPTQGFEPSIEVTDGRGSADTDFLGDYKGIALSGPDVLIVWQDTRRDAGDIYFSRAPGAAGP